MKEKTGRYLNTLKSVTESPTLAVLCWVQLLYYFKVHFFNK